MQIVEVSIPMSTADIIQYRACLRATDRDHLDGSGRVIIASGNLGDSLHQVHALNDLQLFTFWRKKLSSKS